MCIIKLRSVFIIIKIALIQVVSIYLNDMKFSNDMKMIKLKKNVIKIYLQLQVVDYRNDGCSPSWDFWQF